MYKRQRKTSDCEADICFSGAYNEQMSCEAGRKAAYKAGDALEDGQEWKAVFRPRHVAGVCSG